MKPAAIAVFSFSKTKVAFTSVESEMVYSKEEFEGVVAVTNPFSKSDLAALLLKSIPVTVVTITVVKVIAASVAVVTVISTQTPTLRPP